MPLEAVVRVHFEGTVAYQNGFAANVSATGMFVKHPDPPPVGTRLVFEFTVGSRRLPVQGAGTVVWIREKYEGPGRPAGMGIQFTQLDQKSREHLTEALFEFLEASLATIPEAQDMTEAASQPCETPLQLPKEEPGLLEPLSLGEEGLELEATVAAGGSKPPEGSKPQERSKGWELASPREAVGDVPKGGVFSGKQAPDLVGSLPRAEETSTQPPGLKKALEDTGSRYGAPRAPTIRQEGASSSPISPQPPSSPRPQLDALSRFPVAETLKAPEATAATPRAAVAEGELERARRQRRYGLAAVFVLLALGFGGWWWWSKGSRVGSRAEGPAPSPRPQVATPTPAPSLPPVTPMGQTLAETVGARPAAEVAPSVPLPPEQATPTLQSEPTPGVADTAASPPKTDSREVGEALAPTAELPRARALTEVTTSEALGVTTIILTFDGGLLPGNYTYSEIGGDQPRWLLRLRQMGEPYRKQRLELGTTAVKAIRFGWHSKPEGFEQHVVVDLANKGVRLEGFEVLGSRIVARFGNH